MVNQMAPRTTIPEPLTRAIGMGTVLVDIGSIPTDHSLTHIPPLPVSNMRPLALETADPLRVNILLNDTQFSIRTVFDTMEWMGQTTQVHHAWGARSLNVIYGASLQKQFHPHMLGVYLDQPELSVIDRPPQVRWSKKSDSIYARLDRSAPNRPALSYGSYYTNHCRIETRLRIDDGYWRH